ncbi:drug/metabolite transporter superfamily [Guyanagaster necrorhizus]|uniref:Drug/metabolite transporter superfamily n=1 Tax=Guyanagaster necrorhizus TaxID=856835 RepID=A0A9P7VKS6_9AGAR|nr:drug/metabolite transporter superfamily [Guyanagaster necrorhizus MCA 3950]KAG7442170.1 drug/metabolite transporter superfamily [Guyanagaster necrorhizus MCA 3950]
MTVEVRDENTPLLPKAVLRDWRSSLKDAYQRNTGFLLIVAASFIFSIGNVCVKELNRLDDTIPRIIKTEVLQSITYLGSVTYMLCAGIPEPFRGPHGARALLVFRGICGFTGICGVYYSLKYLSLSEATVLTFLMPTTTAVAGAVFLGETVSVGQIIAGPFSISGVICIAQPESLFGDLPVDESRDPEHRLLAVGVALIGVLGTTAAFTTIRAIGSRAHALHSLASFSLQSVIASSIGIAIMGTPLIFSTHWKWIALFLALGITGFFGQLLITMGLQRETAGRGTTAVYTQIVFATILERVFFNFTPDSWSVVGIVIIVTAALYVALSKRKERVRDTLEPPESA